MLLYSGLRFAVALREYETNIACSRDSVKQDLEEVGEDATEASHTPRHTAPLGAENSKLYGMRCPAPHYSVHAPKSLDFSLRQNALKVSVLHESNLLPVSSLAVVDHVVWKQFGRELRFLWVILYIDFTTLHSSGQTGRSDREGLFSVLREIRQFCCRDTRKRIPL